MIMTILFYLLWIILLVVAAAVVTLILMQEGKGGSLTGAMGASMGETFGFGGATRQIKKFTAIAAGIFMVLCILITVVGRQTVGKRTADFADGPAGEAAAPTITAPVATGAETQPGVTVPVNGASAGLPPGVQVVPAPAAAPATEASAPAPAPAVAPAATDAAPAPTTPVE